MEKEKYYATILDILPIFINKSYLFLLYFTCFAIASNQPFSFVF